MIDYAAGGGGAERLAAGLARSLPRDRFETWVCSTRSGPDGGGEPDPRDGVRYMSLERRTKWDLPRLRRLADLMREQRFDVVHAHMHGSNAWASVFGSLYRVPVILAHEHNWSYADDRMRILLDRWFISRLATRFIAVSEANRETMMRLEHIPDEKIIVLPTAYVPHDINRPLDLRADLGLPANSLLVGVAAYFREEKALDVLIRAMAIVTRQIPEAHLVIAGKGDCKAELERLVDDLTLREHVHFLGSRRDVTSILDDVQLGAMSSDWEGMPLFVFECMATHTPIVATNVGGLPEIVDNGETGVLVPPRDPDALAAAISRLLTDPSYRDRLADAAGERLGQFTIERLTDRFAELYETLYERATGHRGEPRSRVGA
ncbi:MAG: glycosyltransferase [Solirubrobacteraceae bacterium]